MHYYVTIRNGRQCAPLVGPFFSQDGASSWLEANRDVVVRRCEELDRWAVFYDLGVGTFRRQVRTHPAFGGIRDGR